MLNHRGSKVIETNRIMMRKFTLDDADAMYENWASDPKVTKYLTWRAHANKKISQDVVETWCAHYKENTYHWAVVLKETNQPIGSIGIGRLYEEENRAEFGYTIGQKHWNKGLVTEAMTALLDYFFNEIGFERIDGLHDVQNPASGKVMKKLNMTYTDKICGEFKDNQGNPIDTYRYSIDKEHFNGLQIRKAYGYEVDVVAGLYDKLVNHLNEIGENLVGWNVGTYPTLSVAKAGYDGECLYVATLGGRIVGTCILNTIQADVYATVRWQVECENPLVVHTLAIDPEFLQHGLGRKLLDFADELAVKQGIPVIRLDTSEFNTPAKNLYEKVGYKHMGDVDLLLERDCITCWYVYEKIVHQEDC